MFVRNKTQFSPVLSRGSLSDEVDVGAIVVELRSRVVGERLELVTGPMEHSPTDPPDVTKHPLWRGTSVTASGDVLGPSRPPFVRAVQFAIGNEVRRLAVFGNRHWDTSLLGGLVASEPAAFHSIPMSFERAFGGSYILPPGLLPGTDLPHPGGEVSYPLNEHGIGFYPDKNAAVDAPLPNLELADQLLKQWNDQPEPGCFAPCPDLVALRLRHVGVDHPIIGPEDAITPAFQAKFASRAFTMSLHHAPGYLVFDELAPGTPIQLVGLGKAIIRFSLPESRLRVTLRRGQNRTDVPPRIRSVHVDAEKMTVSCVYGYEFRYHEGTAPSWILIDS
ncbi:DUF2169 domain-containing protein [Polyangium sp. 15x6]|uniref:DUF2169 domain-containing protein n=1 Tax=Polyangium sp. 15x6 TaxID=3042687 RepID=UPI00249A2E98|nr:DUF2169 domain-containing protein [Polyangium sp. 15x6]MDI3291754.1 DUF2169 domain-containing protein [Polyangium sp. 15x6]